MISPFPKSEKSKEELFFRLLEHKNTVFYICLGYTSDYPQAEELTQEVYLKVWEKIETIETGLNLKAWVLTLAKNKCLDHVRREKIRRSFLVDLIARKQNKMNVSQNTPEKDLALREEQIRLKRTVLDLPEKLKQVIVLREYGECSCQQIATILNIKLGTVHSRLNRAKIRIQKNVEEDNEKQN